MSLFQRETSARETVLLWHYRVLYGEFEYLGSGEGPSPELRRLLRQQSLSDAMSLEDFQSVFPEPKLAEPRILAQILRARATRTLRQAVNQSRWLRHTQLGCFLWEQPERFLEIRGSPRFPRFQDEQVEFLSRSIAGVLSRYEPSTAVRYLARLVERCELCEKRPAFMVLIRDGRRSPWCGNC